MIRSQIPSQGISARARASRLPLSLVRPPDCLPSGIPDRLPAVGSAWPESHEPARRKTQAQETDARRMHLVVAICRATCRTAPPSFRRPASLGNVRAGSPNVAIQLARMTSNQQASLLPPRDQADARHDLQFPIGPIVLERDCLESISAAIASNARSGIEPTPHSTMRQIASKPGSRSCQPGPPRRTNARAEPPGGTTIRHDDMRFVSATSRATRAG